jgi:hypothetical protein
VSIHPSKSRLPSFVGIGPARTGTTWLDDVLREVAGLPHGVKETWFFRERYYQGIQWYSDHFRFCDDKSPIGEICPYFPFPQTIERIHTHIPDCKIICTFRDPVDRAYSFYKLMRRLARARGSFEETLATKQVVSEGNRYAFHLHQWQQRFGTHRVLVTLYDDLVTSPQEYLDRVCDFVGARRVDLAGKSFRSGAFNRAERAPRNEWLAKFARRVMRRLLNHRAYLLVNFLDERGVWKYCFGGGEPYPSLDPELEAQLRERFRPEVEALEEMIGRDLSPWKRPTREVPDRILNKGF